MRVEEYAFHRELLDNVFIFKIPEELHTHPYVTEDFKKLIEQNNIKGFKFVPVWEEKWKDSKRAWIDAWQVRFLEKIMVCILQIHLSAM